MNLKPMSFAHIMSVADIWRDIGGSPKIEIGALEPLLWRDGQYRIYDVVAELTNRNFVVTLTTNGQLLDVTAEELGRAKLSLIRTSWHSTNPVLFQEISGGYGDYSRFIRGINLAVDAGIKIAFNRVLLKGYTNDIPEQLSFVESHRCRLKLYSLLWTPIITSSYNNFYQDWRPVVRELIVPRIIGITRVKKGPGRRRLMFHLARGGSVEVKVGDTLDRSSHPCAMCSFKDKCEEAFGDYVRIDPRLALYFCYMRRDIGFQLQDYFGRPSDLKAEIQRVVGPEANVCNMIATTPLRLTVTPFCNFNCRIPGAKEGWCMEEPGDFHYPKIKDSLL